MNKSNDNNNNNNKIFTFKLRSPHVWYAIFSLMEHVPLILQEILIQNIHSSCWIKV